jgi:hypothetical protein
MAGLAVRQSVTLAGRAERARVARALAGALPGPGHPCGDTVVLLVSELFGNSVRHSGSGADHIDRFGSGPGGRAFSPKGGLVGEATYLPTYLSVFHAARSAALTKDEVAAGLLPRPFYLRHAAVSTWLNAGVPATQVAEWAGHSVDALLRVYAKCIAGQQDEAKRRIDEATRWDDSDHNRLPSG